MNQFMVYKDFLGSAEISLEDSVLHGKIQAIDDLVTYEATTINALESAFHEAVDDYLTTCDAIGRKPDTPKPVVLDAVDSKQQMA